MKFVIATSENGQIPDVAQAVQQQRCNKAPRRTNNTHGFGGESSSGELNRWTLDRYHYDYTTDIQPVSTSDFTVYPNPAGSNTAETVDGLKPNEVIELRDMQGRLITSTLAADEQVTSMNLSGIAAGMYLVKAGAISKKLILQ